MYGFGTGSPVELLDIGVFVDRVPPRLHHSSEALHVTQTHGRSSRHDGFGGSNEPEDCGHGARQRRGDHGERKRTSSANTLEERKRPGTANAVEEWKRAGSPDALEVTSKSPQQ